MGRLVRDERLGSGTPSLIALEHPANDGDEPRRETEGKGREKSRVRVPVHAAALRDVSPPSTEGETKDSIYYPGREFVDTLFLRHTMVNNSRTG